MADLLARSVLLAPAAVARAAARRMPDDEQRWMLHQPRQVRASYVRQVLEPGDGDPLHQQVWMLRQPRSVRQSFIREVLSRLPEPPRQEMWMLRQPDRVRESFIREVLEPRAR